MKKFFIKNFWVFCVGIIFIALLSNIGLGFVQERYAQSIIMFYIIQAVCKLITALLPIFLIVKWKLAKKTEMKYIILGLLAGTPAILLIAENLLTLTLVNPLHFKIYGSIVTVIIIAEIAVGLMEEAGIRGVLLPMLCEKKGEKKGTYMKAAIISSMLFGIVHLSWSLRKILFWESLSKTYFGGNLYQVFYTFCFGMLAAGVTLYARSIIPIVIWHSLIDISAFIDIGLMQYTNYAYYHSTGLLTLQNVYKRYGIMHGAFLCSIIIDIICLVIGIIFVNKAERRDIAL